MERSIQFQLNGLPTTIRTDDQRKLLWVLRTDLGLTGTKYGCGEGLCGACTVVVGDKTVFACKTALGAVEGQNVVTIEGLAHDGHLHPLQQAFVDHGAMQCGYCTPGMLLSAHVLLRRNPNPSPAAIRDHMDGNLCRCGAHQRIVDAIASAARRMGGST
jgi:nicotinate dehydrogenase subunit A